MIVAATITQSIFAECTYDNVNNDDFDLKDANYDIDNAEITEMPPQNAG